MTKYLIIAPEGIHFDPLEKYYEFGSESDLKGWKKKNITAATNAGLIEVKHGKIEDATPSPEVDQVDSDTGD